MIDWPAEYDKCLPTEVMEHEQKYMVHNPFGSDLYLLTLETLKFRPLQHLTSGAKQGKVQS